MHTILDELHGTALFLDLEALSPAHLKAVIVRRDKFDHGVRQVLEEGMAAGIVRHRRSEAAGVRAVRRGELDPALVSTRTGPATSQAIADLFADFFISGLRNPLTARS